VINSDFRGQTWNHNGNGIMGKMRFSVIFGAKNKWGHPVKKVGPCKYDEKSGRLVDLDPPLVEGHPSFLLKIKILNCYW
jgi:hypothetical protein